MLLVLKMIYNILIIFEISDLAAIFLIIFLSQFAITQPITRLNWYCGI